MTVVAIIFTRLLFLRPHRTSGVDGVLKTDYLLTLLLLRLVVVVGGGGLLLLLPLHHLLLL